ncbi:hypothetical protein HYW54_03705 [Candidatus Gottesmanbacteria bacterium]|nr:hypothetical protein [Candidatus Gottesmanbacteria bacterium]
MIDPIQILIIVVVSSLTILLIVIGIQIVFILQEIRKSFQKINKMLDDMTTVSSSFSKSVTNLSGFTSGLSGFLHFFRLLIHKKEDQDAKREE